MSKSNQQKEWADIIEFDHTSTSSWAFHHKSDIENNYVFGFHNKNKSYGVEMLIKPFKKYQILLKKYKTKILLFVNNNLDQILDDNSPLIIDYLGDENLNIKNWKHGDREWNGEIDCLILFKNDLKLLEKNTNKLCNFMRYLS